MARGIERDSVLSPAADAASPWFDAHRDELAAAARQGPILDLACGRGRHALPCARAGWRTLALDRDASLLSALTVDRGDLPLQALRADVEASPAIPLKPGSLAAVLVFRFLSRPLALEIERALQPGGILIYETFTLAQRSLGWGPTRDAFLLARGELAGMFSGLETLAYEEGRRSSEPPEEVASLLARKPITPA